MLVGSTSLEASQTNGVARDIIPPCPTIVGDNFDKSVIPRHMTMEHQRKSLHYFHSYAVLNRIDFSGLSSSKPVGDISDLTLSSYLPDAADCAKLCENYSVILARVIVEELSYFRVFRDCVVDHIKHKYSSQMKEKSVVVS